MMNWILSIFNYEVFIEKSIIEILSSKFVSLTLNLYSFIITNIKINAFFTIIIYVIYFLIYIINFIN